MAERAGDTAKANKLGKVLKLFGGVSFAYSVYKACGTAREQGLEAGAIELVMEESLVVQGLELLDEGRRAGTGLFKDFVADFKDDGRIAKAKKSFNKRWLSELSEPERKEAMDYGLLTEDDLDADWIDEAAKKGLLDSGF